MLLRCELLTRLHPQVLMNGLPVVLQLLGGIFSLNQLCRGLQEQMPGLMQKGGPVGTLKQGDNRLAVLKLDGSTLPLIKGYAVTEL